MASWQNAFEWKGKTALLTHYTSREREWNTCPPAHIVLSGGLYVPSPDGQDTLNAGGWRMTIPLPALLAWAEAQGYLEEEIYEEPHR